MNLTSGQLTTLKNDIVANTFTIDFGGSQVQIKDLPNSPDANVEIANWYNGFPAVDYWVWRTIVQRIDIYNTTSDAATTWDWTLYKNQSVTEQNAWVQMFMGDRADFSKTNLRAGIGKIFTAGSTGNRDHSFAIGREKATRVGKLLSVAITSPPANSGNDGIANNRGKTSNPDLVGTNGGDLTGDNVTIARNS